MPLFASFLAVSGTASGGSSGQPAGEDGILTYQSPNMFLSLWQQRVFPESFRATPDGEKLSIDVRAKIAGFLGEMRAAGVPEVDSAEALDYIGALALQDFPDNPGRRLDALVADLQTYRADLGDWVPHHEALTNIGNGSHKTVPDTTQGNKKTASPPKIVSPEAFIKKWSADHFDPGSVRDEGAEVARNFWENMTKAKLRPSEEDILDALTVVGGFVEEDFPEDADDAGKVVLMRFFLARYEDLYAHSDGHKYALSAFLGLGNDPDKYRSPAKNEAGAETVLDERREEPLKQQQILKMLPPGGVSF